MRRAIAAARHLALFIAIVATAFPFVLNLFIRLDGERYIWVITQPGRCGFLGSGPLLLFVAGQSWLIGFFAFTAFVLTRRGQSFPTAAALAGGIVVALSAALVVSAPQFVASLMGCVR